MHTQTGTPAEVRNAGRTSRPSDAAVSGPRRPGQDQISSWGACFKCGGTGHFAHECRSRAQVHEVTVDSDYEATWEIGEPVPVIEDAEQDTWGPGKRPRVGPESIGLTQGKSTAIGTYNLLCYFVSSPSPVEETRASGVVLKQAADEKAGIVRGGVSLVPGFGAQGMSAYGSVQKGLGPSPEGAGSGRENAGAGALSPPPPDKVPASVAVGPVRDRVLSEQGFCEHDSTDCEALTSHDEHGLTVRDPGVQASGGSLSTEEGRGHLLGLAVGAGPTLGGGCQQETGSSWASVNRGSAADGTGGHGHVSSCAKTLEELTLTGDPVSPRGQSSWGQQCQGVSSGGPRADCEVQVITQEMLGCLGVRDGPGARTEWGSQTNLLAENTSAPVKLGPPCSSKNQAGDGESVTVRMVGSVSLRAPMQVMDIEVMAVVDKYNVPRVPWK